MEAILLLFFGYLLSRAINGKKPRKSKRRNSTYNSGGTYSDYDTWRKSHGDQNKLF